ncbi:MAG: peptide ABC transporter substrate-binding protein [Pyrinomonadaceae bacterium]
MNTRLIGTIKKLTGSYGSFFVCAIFTIAVFSSACTQIEPPKKETFFAVTTPPKAQEFRWSNGKMPKSLDPAQASAAPETDIVRSIFEGLTEIDPKTLKEVPAVAEKWSSSKDHRVWTFHLRKDARWSNGKRVTAADFVASWKRLVDLGDKTAHPELFRNIVGMHDPKAEGLVPIESVDFGHTPSAGTANPQTDTLNSNNALKLQNQVPVSPSPVPQIITPPKPSAPKAELKPVKFGVEALGDHTLTVTLERPDKDLAKLVANPIFRPVYGDGKSFELDPIGVNTVTNGAFKLTSAGKDGIVLERSDSYWNKANVSLDRVRFVPKDSADSALDAYKRGEIDALTNAAFEPLALKLLAPYEDFRQTTHSALNFYEVNAANAPFNDRRVREALAIAIDRERVTEAELDGATQPAMSFLPLGERKHSKLALDVDRAKQLLELAGYPNGENFPKIRLVVNRNDIQQRVARSVAKMWKQNINLDTDILVKDSAEMEAVRVAGAYDLIRRGVVLPTLDESVSLAAIFGIRTMEMTPAADKEAATKESPSPTPTTEMQLTSEGGPSGETIPPADPAAQLEPSPAAEIFTEQDAVYELNAIPLYFPTSYSLVKPYVRGFEINGLDAASLKDISIDSDWQPRSSRAE